MQEYFGGGLFFSYIFIKDGGSVGTEKESGGIPYLFFEAISHIGGNTLMTLLSCMIDINNDDSHK